MSAYFKAALIAASAAVAVAALGSAQAADEVLVDAPGRAAVVDNCGGCHGLDLIPARARTTAEWSGLVESMAGYGMVADDATKNQIVTYLVAAYGAPEGR